MAKWIKYNHRMIVEDKIIDRDENGDFITNIVEREIITPMMVRDNNTGRAIAEKEAYGEIETYDDGKPDPAAAPTNEERIEALEAAVTMLCMPDVDTSSEV